MTIYFTCRNRNDGLGAQACGIISVMVLAHALNYKFVYTPMQFIAHYPYPEPSQSELRLWVMAWEQLLNFEDHHPHFSKTSGPHVHIKKCNIDGYFNLDKSGKLTSSFQDGHIYSTRETHTVLTKHHQHPQIAKGWELTLRSIRDGYGRDRKDTPHFDNRKGVINIAVHVRRGDSTNNARRFVGHTYFVGVLKSITEYLKVHGKKWCIQLYSEGKREDLPEFEQFSNVMYRLNEDHFDTLHHMVCADVLVMSKSTFSYLPALLNNHGTIVYKPFWLLPPKPLEHQWIVAHEDGTITQDLLAPLLRIT
jgi:hypothetical protein